MKLKINNFCEVEGTPEEVLTFYIGIEMKSKFKDIIDKNLEDSNSD